MLVPQYAQDKAVDENGYFTNPWQETITQLLNYIQANIGNEGFKIPPVSSDPADNQVAKLEAAYATQGSTNTNNQQGGITIGTLIFDPYEVNGSVDPLIPRYGQLKVLLADGLFHKVTNT